MRTEARPCRSVVCIEPSVLTWATQLPGLDREHCGRARMALNHLGLNDCLDIHLLPVRRDFGKQCIEIDGIVEYFSSGFRTFLGDAGSDDRGLPGDAVVDASHNRVVARK